MTAADWANRFRAKLIQRMNIHNEHDLMGSSVDLHRQPGFEQRIHVFYEVLKDALGDLERGPSHAELVAGAFVSLASGSVRAQLVDLTREEPYSEPLNRYGSDAEHLNTALGRITERVNLVEKPQAAPLIVQIPYFVSTSLDPELNRNFDNFAEAYLQGDVVYTKLEVGEKPDTDWIAQHDEDRYAQRFVLVLGVRTANGFGSTLKLEETAHLLRDMLGLTLSNAGLTVADSTRSLIAGIASDVLLMSHEFLRPFVRLQQYLARVEEGELPEDLIKICNDAVNGAASIGTSELLEPREWSYGKAGELLAEAMAHVFDKPPTIEDLHGQTHSLSTDIAGGIRRLELECDFQFDLSQALIATTLVKEFSLVSLVLRNIVSNAILHRSAPDQAVVLRLTLQETAHKTVEMRFEQRGVHLDPRVWTKFFRQPTRSTLGGGYGLFTVGLVFESLRFQPPRAYCIDNTLYHIFDFPMKLESSQ